MGALASCWLLVESFVVPHGFLKWFYLSFYIHPFLLVFCQIFLWLKELLSLIICLFHPFTAAFRLVFGFVFALYSYVISPSSHDDLFYDAVEPKLFKGSRIAVHRSRGDLGVFEMGIRLYPISQEETNHDDISCVYDSWLNEYLNSNCVASFEFDSMDESVDTKSSEGTQVNSCDDPLLLEDVSRDGSVSPFSCSDSSESSSEADILVDDHERNSPVLKQQPVMRTDGEKDSDQFHHNYTSRVRFFDVLYRERLQGIDAFSIEHSSSPESIEALSRRAWKRVVRSLECDLEMIQVAQCCLFWEALHHQYQKVEYLLHNINYGNRLVFHHDISGKFQELEIMLERFVDDQKIECKVSSSSSSSSSSRKRLSFQALLHVPDVTGFVVGMEEEEKKMMSEEYCIGSTTLLQAIQHCINAFWLYIRTDEKKPFGKLKAILGSTHLPVEDPLDLELLYNVVKTLHKKGIMLRNEEGKNKCWMRRKVKPIQGGGEHEKTNLVFAMIDMKLVQTMLKMSSISRSHLKWCQHKLDNIHLNQQGVFRNSISQLFPLP